MVEFLLLFRYGGVLLPRDSDVTWNYHSGGCISMPSGEDRFTLHLDLPQGSCIDYLRLYYYDTNITDDLQAYLTLYNGLGAITSLTNVRSTGDGRVRVLVECLYRPGC